MRSILLAGALMAVAPLAVAQPAPGSPPPPQTYLNGTPQDDSPQPSHAMTQAQPDPNNCGTPDEPKACPPLPRHALASYPANR